jgi:branched-chain amino acid transport system substrate-binding protein
MTLDRRSFVTAAGALGASSLLGPNVFAQSGAPIKVGGTLSLTGPLASPSLIHKITGELYVDSLNKRGGLLGRPVEWVLKDDQSRADTARTLYEQLVTSDKVDLLIGPYGTGTILSAMGVAQRYNKTIVHHTFGIPNLAKYDQQFHGWAIGPEPEKSVPNVVLDALAASPKPPKTVAIVTSKFPSVHFISQGAREVVKQRGLTEVLFLEWEFGNRDYGPIAGRIKDANPDLIFAGALGLEGNMLLDALKKIDFQPRHHFYYVPAPGPMVKAPEGDGALSITIFEDHPPFTNNPKAAEFVREYRERATRANLPDTSVETQAAASFSAWEILEAGVKGANSLDDKAIAAWLRQNQVDTIQGRMRFNEKNNFGADFNRVKQVQNGKWVTVWPQAYAAPGAKLQVK